jgi:uncharacterized membrane protein YphA (DoxX/SURF4 family)
MSFNSSEQAAHAILRIGLAFSFLYPPYAALSDPVSWAGYFPAFVHALPVPIIVLLHAFGAVEAAIALWLLSGWQIRVPAALAAAILLAIVALDINDFAVLFRDLTIAAIAIALVIWPSPGAQPSRAAVIA